MRVVYLVRACFAACRAVALAKAERAPTSARLHLTPPPRSLLPATATRTVWHRRRQPPAVPHGGHVRRCDRLRARESRRRDARSRDGGRSRTTSGSASTSRGRPAPAF